MSDPNERAIKTLQSYIRIPSVQPDVDYSECISFLCGLAEECGLQYFVLEVYPKKPVLVMTWLGSDPSLGSIVLNSHMDVVPVEREYWTHDPFGAEIDEDGNIFGRGTQDTKGLGVQFLEAVRRLKDSNVKLLRTVHLFFVPDEEDGIDGIEKFINTDEFRALNVAFVLDEGEANPGPEFFIYNAEKAIWHVIFNVNGTEGHGSLNLLNTPGEKLRRIFDRVMDFRKIQQDKLVANQSLSEGDITFVNATVVHGGNAPNSVPSIFSATFDFRLAVDEDHDEFARRLESWARDAGEGVQIDYYAREPPTPATPTDSSNKFWTSMKNVFDSISQPILIRTLPGGTDSRFLRRIGIPCIAWSPMNNTPDLAHSNDEFINTAVFLRGIEIMLRVVPALANVPSQSI